MPWRSSMERFQSTHPARGATFFMVHASFRFLFQSTHPARGATYNIALVRYRPKDFNPRTPRGVRLFVSAFDQYDYDFNPRTPRGVRLLQEQEAELEQVFQSTHPARGATHRHIQGRQYSKISIHAPREGCDEHNEIHVHTARISIHAPREGCDRSIFAPSLVAANFNPRTPRGVRRFRRRGGSPLYAISIHAPREGCDKLIPPVCNGCSNFNPRTPRGVRRRDMSTYSGSILFQSTHPARGATRPRSACSITV